MAVVNELDPEVFESGMGGHGDRPHINLLIEDIPKYSNDYASVDYIFNYRLPRKVKCIMHKSADVNQ